VKCKFNREAFGLTSCGKKRYGFDLSRFYGMIFA
jgi:hypothetical protein